MKIYRAVISYNNGDYNEWERTYEGASQWYTSRELAEKHLPYLQEFKDFLRDKNVEEYWFRVGDPHIEEMEVSNKFVPLTLWYGEEKFQGFNYIPYTGSMGITSQELLGDITTTDSWTISVCVGQEEFIVDFPYYNKEQYTIEKNTQENSNFYKYCPEVRNQMMGICKEYAESILSYSKGCENSGTEETWESIQCTRLDSIARLLSNTHIVLSEYTIECITRKIEKYKIKDQKYPKLVESLCKLLSYTSNIIFKTK